MNELATRLAIALAISGLATSCVEQNLERPVLTGEEGPAIPRPPTDAGNDPEETMDPEETPDPMDSEDAAPPANADAATDASTPTDAADATAPDTDAAPPDAG